MCARCARDAREMRGVGRRKCALRVRCSKIDSRSRRARGGTGVMRWGIRRIRGDTDGLFAFLFARAV